MIEAQTYCVPNSILCAWTWGAKTGDKVGISVTKISEGVDHSQAFAIIDGVQIPLTEVWDPKGFIKIIPYKLHYDIKPYRYLTLREWIDEQFKYTNQPEPVKTVEPVPITEPTAGASTARAMIDAARGKVLR